MPGGLRDPVRHRADGRGAAGCGDRAGCEPGHRRGTAAVGAQGRGNRATRFPADGGRHLSRTLQRRDPGGPHATGRPGGLGREPGRVARGGGRADRKRQRRHRRAARRGAGRRRQGHLDRARQAADGHRAGQGREPAGRRRRPHAAPGAAPWARLVLRARFPRARGCDRGGGRLCGPAAAGEPGCQHLVAGRAGERAGRPGPARPVAAHPPHEPVAGGHEQPRARHRDRQQPVGRPARAEGGVRRQAAARAGRWPADPQYRGERGRPGAAGPCAAVPGQLLSGGRRRPDRRQCGSRHGGDRRHDPQPAGTPGAGERGAVPHADGKQRLDHLDRLARWRVHHRAAVVDGVHRTGLGRGGRAGLDGGGPPRRPGGDAARLGAGTRDGRHLRRGTPPAPRGRRVAAHGRAGRAGARRGRCDPRVGRQPHRYHRAPPGRGGAGGGARRGGGGQPGERAYSWPT